MIISLGRRLPGASSDLPESRHGSGQSAEASRPFGRADPVAPLFGLAPGGVCRARPVTRPAGELLPHRFTLTATTVSTAAVCFLWHFPFPKTGRWALPTTAPCGVRTFLLGMSSSHVSMKPSAEAIIQHATSHLHHNPFRGILNRFSMPSNDSLRTAASLPLGDRPIPSVRPASLEFLAQISHFAQIIYTMDNPQVRRHPDVHP